MLIYENTHDEDFQWGFIFSVYDINHLWKHDFKSFWDNLKNVKELIPMHSTAFQTFNTILFCYFWIFLSSAVWTPEVQ